MKQALTSIQYFQYFMSSVNYVLSQAMYGQDFISLLRFKPNFYISEEDIYSFEILVNWDEAKVALISIVAKLSPNSTQLGWACIITAEPPSTHRSIKSHFYIK